MQSWFHRAAKAEVENLLQSEGVRFSVLEFDNPEQMTKITMFPGLIEIWIYPDGAGILGDKIDERFELADFNSLADLKLNFIHRLSLLVTQRS